MIFLKEEFVDFLKSGADVGINMYDPKGNTLEAKVLVCFIKDIVGYFPD